jgi:hypothetical protein
MNKVTCAAVLIAVSMSVQAGPAAQSSTTAGPESTGFLEGLSREQLTEKLRDLGYFNNSDQPKFNWGQLIAGTVTAPTRCVIPMLTTPTPDAERFASKTIPANPSIDPKMVKPPMPVCPQRAAPPPTAPEPQSDNK